MTDNKEGEREKNQYNQHNQSIATTSSHQ